MKSILVFLALVAISHARDVRMPRVPDQRLSYGDLAEVGDFPYQVSVMLSSSIPQVCSGTIIKRNYVITTANCVKGYKPNWIKVYAGTTDLWQPQSIHSVLEIIVHDKYDKEDNYKNDIALIKVKDEFEFSETINYIPLVEKNVELVNSVAVASGWGIPTQTGMSFTQLRYTDVIITNPNDCGDKIHRSQICNYAKDSIYRYCSGGAGGPITVDGKLVGVVSRGWDCGSASEPVPNTKITEYIDWINDNAV